MRNAPFLNLSTQEVALLQALGERLRLARRRRKLTAEYVAEKVGITRVTLRRAEAGEPGVQMGTYVRVLAALGLAQDLVLVARDDLFGRGLQDDALAKRAAPKTALPRRIRLADYPVLQQVAWSASPDSEFTPQEAFALLERNWRHVDREAMTSKDQELVERLTATVGKGALLV